MFKTKNYIYCIYIHTYMYVFQFWYIQVILMVYIVLASHAWFKGLSLCPSESWSMIEANMGRALQSFNLNPNKPPPVSSIYTFPSPDLPHVESRLLISLLFCLSTSDPLIFTTVSEDLSLTFKHCSYPQRPCVPLFAVSLPLAFLLHRSCTQSLFPD